MSTVTLDASLLTVFLLVLARVAGWAAITPLLGSRAMTASGRIALTVGLALVLAAPVAALPQTQVPGTLGQFALAVLVQFLFGAAFGFLTGMLLYAAAVAGSLVDYMSGLGYAAIIDPASGQQSAVFSRFFALSFLALLMATDAYASMITGLARTFTVVPLGPSVPFPGLDPLALASGVTDLLRAAFEVGAPLLGVLLLTEAVLAIAARFFPQANVAFLGLSLKALVAVLAAGAVLTLLPGRIDGLLDGGLTLAQAVLG